VFYDTGVKSYYLLISFVIYFLFQKFGSLSLGEFQLIRQTLLNFFQDMHIRVSIKHT